MKPKEAVRKTGTASFDFSGAVAVVAAAAKLLMALKSAAPATIAAAPQTG
ncbi:hypothetical protein [Botryobacter ruber]|nr:hypothetical protein [Botryobacter ruber]